MFREKRPVGNRGQALAEMIVVMPVLLLLLLAAAEMGKLFVISGKSEISARYIALSHFREVPFGDAYPTLPEGREIEGLFFDDALDDHSESDDPDVTFVEIPEDQLGYEPEDLGDPLLIWLWAYMDAAPNLNPMRGARSTFTYDLPSFPYGREHPTEGTRDLEGPMSEGRLAASYDATGNFVFLGDSFSGPEGEMLRFAMVGAGLIIGAQITLPEMILLGGVLWLIFLP